MLERCIALDVDINDFIREPEVSTKEEWWVAHHELESMLMERDCTCEAEAC